MIPLPKLPPARLKTLAIWSGVALALFTLIGFFVVPPILKSVLTDKLSEALHRKVEIAEIRVNPFALSVTVSGFKVLERDGKGPFVSFEELYLNLESTSIFRLGPVLREIRLTKPYVRIVRQQEFTYNFSDLLAKEAPAKAPKPEDASGLPRFSLNNIRVIDASADFLDEPVGKTHTVRKVNVGIPFLSTIPSLVNLFVEPALSAEVNGTHYAAKGKTKPFADTRETTFEINIDNLDIPFYVAYSPVPLKFTIPSGRLDAKLELSFAQPQKQSPILTIKGNVGVKDLGVDDLRKAPVFRLQGLDIGIASAEPLVRKVHLGRIAIQAPKLTVRRDKDGTISLQQLAPQPPKGEKPAASPAPAAPTPLADLLALDIDRIEMTDGGIHFTDLATPTPFKARLEPITLGINQFSTKKDAKASYTLSVETDGKETITVEGTASVDPIATEGAVGIKGIPLKRYAPYYVERVLADIEGGRLDASARYQVALAEKGPDVKASDIAVALSALRVKKRGEAQDFLSVPSFSMKDGSLDLTAMQAKVGSVATQKGALTVVRLPGGEVDLQKLLPLPPAGNAAPAAAPPAASAAPEKPLVVAVGRLTVEDYSVTVEDRVPGQPVTLLAEKIRLTGENLSTAKGSTGTVALDLLLDKTATLSLKTSAGLDPLQAQGTVALTGLQPKRYAPYYRDQIQFDIEEGEVAAATGFQFAQSGAEPDIKAADLTVSLKNFRLKGRTQREEFLSLPAFTLSKTSADLAKKTVVIGEIASQGAVVRAKRAKNGDVNLLQLLPEKPVTEIRGGPSPGAPTAPEAFWTAGIGTAAISGYTVHLEDAVPADPVRLTVDEIAVKADNLSTVRNHKGSVDLSLRFDKKGTLKSQGALGLVPFQAEQQFEAREIGLTPVQPYFTDRVKILLTSGHVSARGRVAVANPESGLQAAYQGDALVGDFAAVDKREAQDLLRWESLGLGEIDFTLTPFKAHLKRVALSNFFARVTIRPDATVNLQDILVKGEAIGEPRATSREPSQTTTPAAPSQAPAQATPAPPSDIKIDVVTLQGGRVQFADASVRPGYTASMVEIGGRVSGLSSQPGTVADLDLRGRLGNQAPLEITGKINPLLQDLYVDIRARFKDMDLSPLTPYAGKYAGYTIEKGKLGFDLKYNIDKRKLNSENVITIDQFTFGEKVESPQATSLPVKFAIALLKDRNGMIRLDIPVTGSLEDPQFSIWSIVWQVIGNLIVKAVTSPFALIGSMFGGGEELSQLEFEPGSAAIAGATKEKLDKLIKGLSDKPGLMLDITGYVDAERDTDALRQELFLRKLQAQKLLEQSRRGGPRVSLEEVQITPEEYPRYLKMAYDFEKFPKPRTALGLVRDLPVPEMEKLMTTHIQVTEDDLHALAGQRARAVQDAILQSGQVAAERLFILEGKALAPAKKEGLKDSRVEFAIKS
jgi:uncharacterized protein involved in outer membrane biogenesis